MANTQSAKKNVRKSEQRRIRNNARLSAIKTAMKKVVILHQAGTAADQLVLALKEVESKLARAKNNVLHRNTAARKLSRLVKKVQPARSTATPADKQQQASH